MLSRETPPEQERARAEKAVLVDRECGSLVGILTPAAPSRQIDGRCVIFLSRPRFDYCRITVEAARRLAAIGLSCFRFDYTGWGDSDGETEVVNPSRPFTDDGLAVLRHLQRDFGMNRFVLWGSCFDARTAISLMESAGDRIDGIAFLAAPLTDFDPGDVYSWRNVMRWSLQAERWRELIFSARGRRRALSGVNFALRRIFHRNLNYGMIPLSPLFERHFEALLRSNARVLFLYGADDGEYPSLLRAQRDLLAAMDKGTKQRFDIEVWPGRVHSIVEVSRQREILERSVEWIARVYGLEPNQEDRLELSAGKGAVAG
jgi:pimeloyl-ACP methyl ester carboxylesterase